jgi:hypothetical protein
VAFFDMTAALFASTKAKLARANELLEMLTHEVQADQDALSYGIELQYTEARQLVAVAKMPANLFEHYSIVAGEIVHHARSSLDHTVWEMVPNPLEGRTGFPISRDPDMFDSRGRRMIEGISEAAAALIERLQPYEPGDDNQLLAVLNELWNRDKHRSINVCVSREYGMTVHHGYPDGSTTFNTFDFPPDAVDGQELFSEPAPGSDVSVHGTRAFGGIAFREGLVEDQHMISVLQASLKCAERVFAALAATV